MTLVALYELSGGDWRNALPWVDIARRSGLGQTTTNQAINDLADASLIQVEPPQNAYLTQAGKDRAEALPPMPTTDRTAAMLPSKWVDVALPILRWVAKHEGPITMVSVQDLSEAVGAEPTVIVTELDRLINDGYLRVSSFSKPLAGGNVGPWHVLGPTLTETGARVTGIWPSGDPGEELLRTLQELVEQEPDPVKKGRLTKVRDSLIDVGTDIVAKFAAEYVRRLTGT